MQYFFKIVFEIQSWFIRSNTNYVLVEGLAYLDCKLILIMIYKYDSTLFSLAVRQLVLSRNQLRIQQI